MPKIPVIQKGSNWLLYLSGSESILWHLTNANVIYLFVDIKMNLVLPKNGNTRFQNHVYNLCRSAGREISIMARIAKYLLVCKRRILLNTFFESLSNYCPCIWMNCGRSPNNKINVLHDRALRIAYNDYSCSFENLLENDFCVTIHQKIYIV